MRISLAKREESIYGCNPQHPPRWLMRRKHRPANHAGCSRPSDPTPAIINIIPIKTNGLICFLSATLIFAEGEAELEEVALFDTPATEATLVELFD